MRYSTRKLFALSAIMLLASLLTPTRQSSTTELPYNQPFATQTGSSAAQTALNKLPLRFEANIGQAAPNVRYLAHGAGYTLFLTDEEVVMILAQPQAGQSGHAKSPPYMSNSANQPSVPNFQAKVLRYKLKDANLYPHLVAANELPGKSNYFIGNDPTKWRTDVPSYARITYQNVYPGIDLVYYGNAGKLEYDFDVAPGADPSRIKLAISGADSLTLTANELVMHTAQGDLRQPAPHIYQDGLNGRHHIDGGYILATDGSIGFSMAAYDVTRPLIIDPSVDYSTYLGGGDTDVANTIKIDGAGNVYVAGSTASTNFPIHNTIQPYAGNGDVFITKLSADGQTLLYSTYLGGTDSDGATGIALDQTGAIYITGGTGSTDFPAHNAFQSSLSGVLDAFVTKLAPAGNALDYSTYLGGNGWEVGYNIAVGSDDSAYVSGYTFSSDFPTHNPIQPTYGGNTDAFVTRFSPTGASLIYSTYLGGSEVEDYDILCGGDIAVDPAGNAYITGDTASTDFPTHNAIQPHIAGTGDAYVTKLSADGSQFIYSTYLGGTGGECGKGIAADSQGNAYITGFTYSTDFPTQNPFQPHNAGDADTFITKLNAAGSILVYSTYLGGSGSEDSVPMSGGGSYHAAIALDDSGNVYVAGRTASSDFPTHDPFQATLSGQFDAYVAKLSNDGASLLYSTYLGGSNNDYAAGIAAVNSGDFYVTGYTASTDFPTANALQASFGGGTRDAFIARFSHLDPTLTPTITGTPPTLTPTPTPTLTYTPIPPSVTPTSQPTVCPNPFVDINGNVFFHAINSLYCQGVINGTDATHYSPAGTASRAEFAKIVVLALNVPLTTPASGQSFTDVPPSFFAYLYIESGYAAGILSGFDAQSCASVNAQYPCYLPRAPITRGQLTKLVVNAAHFTLMTPTGGPTFTDVPPSNIFYAYIETAYAHQVINGYPDGSFRPNNNIRRDEMAQIVFTAQQIIGTPTLTVTGTPPTNTPTPTGTDTPTPGPATATPTDCPNPFVDLTGDPYYNAIHYLYCRGVVEGTDVTHFSPTITATRAVASKALVLGFGLQFYTPFAGQDFTDVPPTDPYYSFVETGYHAGVLDGEDAATCLAAGQVYPCFLPDRAISRAEIAKYIVLAAQYPLYTPIAGQDFTDVPPGDPFYVYIETAYHHGVMDGYSDHTFRPTNPVQRDEMCQFIYNGLTLP